tara:strand:- start:41 stop:334 length:294 start_codon:yes stop_codon:yes gene_type:complete
MILNTPSQIEAFRLIALLGALRLEIIGLKRRGRSAYSLVKDEFNFKGNREKVLNQFTELLIKNNIIEKDEGSELFGWKATRRDYLMSNAIGSKKGSK